MELTEKSFIFTKKIEFDIQGSEEFIELRELNMQEMRDFQSVVSDNNIDNAKAFAKAEQFFPGCVVDSSFVINGEKATGKQIYEFMKRSSPLFMAIIGEWLNRDGDNPFSH